MIALKKGHFRSRFLKIKRYHTHGRTHRSAPSLPGMSIEPECWKKHLPPIRLGREAEGKGVVGDDRVWRKPRGGIGNITRVNFARLYRGVTMLGNGKPKRSETLWSSRRWIPIQADRLNPGRSVSSFLFLQEHKKRRSKIERVERQGRWTWCRLQMSP